MDSSDDSEDSGRHSQSQRHRSDRIVLINPYTQGTIVLQGPAANLLRPPASIESMPRVERQGGGDDGACMICLEEWEWAREMPCGHRFHGECAQRWLRVSGSCPVCRYQMPVDEDEAGKKKRNRVYYNYGGSEREVWVRMSFNSNRNRDTAAAEDVSFHNNPIPPSSTS